MLAPRASRPLALALRHAPHASSAARTRLYASASSAAPPLPPAAAAPAPHAAGASPAAAPRLKAAAGGTKRVHGVRVYPALPDGWAMRIGIETHAQIKTRQKLFSPAVLPPFRPPVPPSTTVAPFDAAVPGTLPRLNPVAVELALRASLALGCHVNPVAQFDRKHYFYRDLPSGYQITMKYSTRSPPSLHAAAESITPPPVPGRRRMHPA